MKYLAAIVIFLCGTLFCGSMSAQEFSCPAGQADMMKYFVLAQSLRSTEYMSGSPNPIYTDVFPNEDFADSGYWFWLKSITANGFDVKSFDENYIYMRSTELVWSNNTTFKRFVNDLPISARCVTEGKAGPEIETTDTSFQYYSSCQPYETSNLGTARTKVDAPVLMDTGGNIGQEWTRILHYHYNCNSSFEHCTDEELFYLANGYGLWQWQYYKNDVLVQTSTMNNLEPGSTNATLPCANSYEQ
jgi:hypothetical protein